RESDGPRSRILVPSASAHAREAAAACIRSASVARRRAGGSAGRRTGRRSVFGRRDRPPRTRAPSASAERFGRSRCPGGIVRVGGRARLNACPATAARIASDVGLPDAYWSATLPRPPAIPAEEPEAGG